MVHVTPALFGQGGAFGGAERYSYELARHMARVTPTMLVSFADRPGRETTSDGLQVWSLGPPWYVRGQRFNPVHSDLVRAIATADVIHCHQTHTLASEIAALVARATRRRVFASDLGGGGWGFSARVNTDGWFQGHLHISRYSRMIAGHETRAAAEVIYGGVDTGLFTPDPSVAKEPLVAFVGRLMPHKGVNDLVEALPPGLTLDLIGRPYHDRFHADLRKLAQGKRVLFRHDCNDQDIVRAYQRALCVVLPSVYRDLYGQESRIPELLGQTLLEGMACGIPAICTDVASMPEIVEHGVTGFVVPANDAAALGEKLCWLRDHPMEARAMGEAARQRVIDKFSWPTVVRRCLDIYAARRSQER